MERGDLSTVASFYWTGPATAESTVDLDGDALKHALVRRLAAREGVRLVDGRGMVANGAVDVVTKKSVSVYIRTVDRVPLPPSLELLVPIADRDRMLLAAEKCVEFQVTAWRPVMFRRSQSVSPRGEGERFREKVMARMCSALEQCGGAWLPLIRPEVDLQSALVATAGQPARVVLDANGTPLPALVSGGAMTLAVGPEGGLEDEERQMMLDGGWRLGSIGSTTLRFETAIISAAAVVRAGQSKSRG